MIRYLQAVVSRLHQSAHADCRTSSQHGYEYANPNYCAHLVGKFSHDVEFGDDPQHYACPECSTPMNAPGPDGQERMWILEIHLLQNPSIGK